MGPIAVVYGRNEVAHCTNRFGGLARRTKRGLGALGKRRRVPVNVKAKPGRDSIEAMLEAVFRWQDKVDALVTTGDDDDDIIATHDSRGRLLELWVRPGLQRELTRAELEDSINEALTVNAKRARAQMQKISDEFLAPFNGSDTTRDPASPGRRVGSKLSSADRQGHNVSEAYSRPALIPVSLRIGARVSP